MRWYHVRVFQPKVYVIQAEDEAHALEKVGELYKELYRHDFQDLVELEPQPEDGE
jgi:hypothetical protein